MNNKKRMQGLGSWAFIFAPILIIPQVSPDNWGPMVGFYYLIPVGPLVVFGPIALILLIILSISNWGLVLYLIILRGIKSELNFETQIIHCKAQAAQYETYIGRIIVSYIAMYFYYLLIAWYSGLDILGPKEALDFAFQFIEPDRSDY